MLITMGDFAQLPAPGGPYCAGHSLFGKLQHLASEEHHHRCRVVRLQEDMKIVRLRIPRTSALHVLVGTRAHLTEHPSFVFMTVILASVRKLNENFVHPIFCADQSLKTMCTNYHSRNDNVQSRQSTRRCEWSFRNHPQKNVRTSHGCVWRRQQCTGKHTRDNKATTRETFPLTYKYATAISKMMDRTIQSACIYPDAIVPAQEYVAVSRVQDHPGLWWVPEPSTVWFAPVTA